MLFTSLHTVWFTYMVLRTTHAATPLVARLHAHTVAHAVPCLHGCNIPCHRAARSRLRFIHPVYRILPTRSPTLRSVQLLPVTDTGCFGSPHALPFHLRLPCRYAVTCVWLRYGYRFCCRFGLPTRPRSCHRVCCSAAHIPRGYHGYAAVYATLIFWLLRCAARSGLRAYTFTRTHTHTVPGLHLHLVAAFSVYMPLQFTWFSSLPDTGCRGYRLPFTFCGYTLPHAVYYHPYRGWLVTLRVYYLTRSAHVACRFGYDFGSPFTAFAVPAFCHTHATTPACTCPVWFCVLPGSAFGCRVWLPFWLRYYTCHCRPRAHHCHLYVLRIRFTQFWFTVTYLRTGCLWLRLRFLLPRCYCSSRFTTARGCSATAHYRSRFYRLYCIWFTRFHAWTCLPTHCTAAGYALHTTVGSLTAFGSAFTLVTAFSSRSAADYTCLQFRSWMRLPYAYGSGSTYTPRLRIYRFCYYHAPVLHVLRFTVPFLQFCVHRLPHSSPHTVVTVRFNYMVVRLVAVTVRYARVCVLVYAAPPFAYCHVLCRSLRSVYTVYARLPAVGLPRFVRLVAVPHARFTGYTRLPVCRSSTFCYTVLPILVLFWIGYTFGLHTRLLRVPRIYLRSYVTVRCSRLPFTCVTFAFCGWITVYTGLPVLRCYTRSICRLPVCRAVAVRSLPFGSLQTHTRVLRYTRARARARHTWIFAVHCCTRTVCWLPAHQLTHMRSATHAVYLTGCAVRHGLSYLPAAPDYCRLLLHGSCLPPHTGLPRVVTRTPFATTPFCVLGSTPHMVPLPGWIRIQLFLPVLHAYIFTGCCLRTFSFTLVAYIPFTGFRLRLFTYTCTACRVVRLFTTTCTQVYGFYGCRGYLPPSWLLLYVYALPSAWFAVLPLHVTPVAPRTGCLPGLPVTPHRGYACGLWMLVIRYWLVTLPVTARTFAVGCLVAATAFGYGLRTLPLRRGCLHAHAILCGWFTHLPRSTVGLRFATFTRSVGWVHGYRIRLRLVASTFGYVTQFTVLHTVGSGSRGSVLVLRSHAVRFLRTCSLLPALHSLLPPARYTRLPRRTLLPHYRLPSTCRLPFGSHVISGSHTRTRGYTLRYACGWTRLRLVTLLVLRLRSRSSRSHLVRYRTTTAHTLRTVWFRFVYGSSYVSWVACGLLPPHYTVTVTHAVLVPFWLRLRRIYAFALHVLHYLPHHRTPLPTHGCRSGCRTRVLVRGSIPFSHTLVWLGYRVHLRLPRRTLRLCWIPATVLDGLCTTHSCYAVLFTHLLPLYLTVRTTYIYALRVAYRLVVTATPHHRAVAGSHYGCLHTTPRFTAYTLLPDHYLPRLPPTHGLVATTLHRAVLRIAWLLTAFTCRLFTTYTVTHTTHAAILPVRTLLRTHALPHCVPRLLRIASRFYTVTWVHTRYTTAHGSHPAIHHHLLHSSHYFAYLPD